MLRSEDVAKCHRALSAFEVHFVELHQCSGSKNIGGPHTEIYRHPIRRRIHQLSASDHATFHGRFADYFKNLLSIEQEPTTARACWRTKDNLPLCPGKRHDLRNLVLSMPLLLTFDIGNEQGMDTLDWDFPPFLDLDSSAPDTSAEVVYDLIGLALMNRSRTHFTARYASHDQKDIYSYDDRKNNGIPIQELNATFSSHMSGEKPNLPSGSTIYQVFYLLRGGLDAQDVFFQMRKKSLSDKLGITFSSGNLDQRCSMNYSSGDYFEMQAKQHTWLFNPFKSTTIEYLSRPPSSNVSNPEICSSLGPESEGSDTDISLRSESSLPDSLFALDCRCGLSGDGNLLYRPEQFGEAIECDRCKSWSHIACQRNGRASDLGEKDIFICDFCDPTFILPSKQRESERK